MEASVKIMRSYDYNHFEISLSDECKSLQAVNELRKSAQRLADEAVRQYKVAKDTQDRQYQTAQEKVQFLNQVKQIQNKPEGERTVNELAVLKSFEDANWESRFECNYTYDDEDPDQWF